jgi:MFS transporter, NNP family, nitrate/nitrite transporter
MEGKRYSLLREAAPHVTFLATMIFFSMYARLLVAPLLVFIQEDLGVGPARATRLFLPLSVAYALAMLGSGHLAERFFHRRTIAASALIIGVGLIIAAFSHSFHGLYVAFTLVGAGAGLYPPSGVAAVTSLVDDHIRGRAIAIHEAGPNVAFVVAPLVVSVGTMVADWRWVAGVSGLAAIVTGLLFDRHAVAGRFPGERVRLHNLKPIMKKRAFWAIFIFFSLAASATIGVYSILPTFLVRVEGMAVGPVNTLLSLSRVSGIGMLFVAGVLVDRIGVARLIGMVFLITGVLTITIGALRGTPMLIGIFLQPVAIAAFFPAAVSAMADLGPARVRNVAVSIIIPGVNIISNGVFPSVMGILTEQGTVRSGFIGLGALMLVSIALVPLLTPPVPGRSPVLRQRDTGFRS